MTDSSVPLWKLLIVCCRRRIPGVGGENTAPQRTLFIVKMLPIRNFNFCRAHFYLAFMVLTW